MDAGSDVGEDAGEDAGVPDAACVEDISKARVCEIAKAECGSIIYEGSCDVIDIDCEAETGASCAPDEACSGDNVCECVPEEPPAPLDVCVAQGVECGMTDTFDSCGEVVGVECGRCDLGDACLEGKCLVDELTSPDAAILGSFGFAVDVDAERLAAGHPMFGELLNSGTVEVFARSNTGWSRSDVLRPVGVDGVVDMGFYNMLFGVSIELTGSDLFVGAPARKNGDPFNNKDAVGGVYHYVFSNGAWKINQVVLPPDLNQVSSLCGSSMLLISNTLFVGCPGGVQGQPRELGPARPGRVEVYRRTAANRAFDHLTTITPPESTVDTRDMFGYALAESSAGLLIGAPTARSADGSQAGAVHVFSLQNGDEFLPARVILPPTIEDGRAFGYALDALNDAVLIGAPSFDLDGNKDLDLQGATYLLLDVGDPSASGMWMTAPNGVVGDGFGYDVALGAGRFIIGAPFHQNHGVAYGGEFGPQMPPVTRQIGRTSPNAEDLTGFSVSFDGSVGAVAAPGINYSPGSSVLFTAGAVLLFPWSRDP